MIPCLLGSFGAYRKSKHNWIGSLSIPYLEANMLRSCDVFLDPIFSVRNYAVFVLDLFLILSMSIGRAKSMVNLCMFEWDLNIPEIKLSTLKRLVFVL